MKQNPINVALVKIKLESNFVVGISSPPAFEEFVFTNTLRREFKFYLKVYLKFD